MIFTTINTAGNEERYHSLYKAVTDLEVIWVHRYYGLFGNRETPSMMYVKQSES